MSDRKEIAKSLARASINASNYITSFFKFHQPIVYQNLLFDQL